MKTDNIYEEKIFSKWITVILLTVIIGLPLALVYQVLILEWYLVFFILFVAIAINFSTLTIKITPQYIIVGYGIFKNKIPWENIEGCYLDKASAIRYGGWGIRTGRVKGKWR